MPHLLSIVWQIPHYNISALGEILFVAIGYQLVYSQSPPSMKACIKAAWEFTSSFGNLLVILFIGGGKLSDDVANQFLFFACLLVCATLLSAFMVQLYEYVNLRTTRTVQSDIRDRRCNNSLNSQKFWFLELMVLIGYQLYIVFESY